MEARIIFKDGTELTAEKNGDSFITTQTPAFPADLSEVEVQCEEGNRTYYNVLVTDCASIDGRYWFAFVEQNQEQQTIKELPDRVTLCEECIMEMSEEVYK